MGALEYLKHYTYHDYVLWKGKWELYEGFPVAMSPSPTITHQAIAYEIARQLGNSVEDCDHCLVLGEGDYKLADDTILRPDVVLICNEPHDLFITKAPEIIVEVISPSTTKSDEGYKFEKYEAEKVNYYLLVYPEECYAKVYQLKDGKYEKQGDFSKQYFEFDKTSCNASINFKKVFNRFK